MRYELLAPAGSYAVFEAVIAAGADAVYLGGEKYSARAFAPNFSDEDILRALDFAHLHGRKVYLTLNTLLKNRETGGGLYRYIEPFYREGLDAIIVQDYGVFQFVRRFFPELPVHISTQMSVANACGAAFLRDRGAKRIIAARELTLDEIRNLAERTGMEIECFVHGALCYCYSGQCLMSSMIGGRSGNRGRCAQPCRLPYRVQDGSGRPVGEEISYPLSMKDLCAIDVLPQLCEAGVCAFKIEGRMKSQAYAAGVTRIYRKYLDLYETNPDRYEVQRPDREALLSLGNRSGFTAGYSAVCPGKDMLTLTGSAHVSAEAESVSMPEDSAKIPVRGKLTLCPGQPAELTVLSDAAPAGEAAEEHPGAGKQFTAAGDVVQQAQKHPLRGEEVRLLMERTGDTPFVFSDLEVEIAGESFAAVSRLNELRRKALDGLSREMLSPYRRPALPEPDFSAESRTSGPGGPAEPSRERRSGGGPFLNVVVNSAEQLAEAAGCDFVDMISIEAAFFPDPEEARETITKAGKKAGFCFPYVFRRGTSDRFNREGAGRPLSRFDALWARSFDSLGYCLSQPEIATSGIFIDAGLYVCSEEARRDFLAEGLGGYTASLEQNAGELSHMTNRQAQFTVYGYTPVMVSAQCVYRTVGKCASGGSGDARYFLSDRYGSRFYVQRDCEDCCNVIYNSRPLSLFHRADEISALGFGSLRICLVTEDRRETAAVLENYRRAFVCGEPVSAPPDADSYTNGHFRRGVE